jgi:alkanesulfonate monooxygenase SsuD/methylene tetrahydromethanopterin reductase-like flavin-dependent oxidoreductase (luciferase family)
MLREYLEAMRSLWSDDEASYAGEFVKFGPSWAWPKPVQGARVPVVIGAGGTDKTHRWVVRSADGWMTTPLEADIESKAGRLREMWRDSGREGSPRIIVLAGKRDIEKLARWEELGVTEVVFGLPDKPEAEVVDYIRHLAGRLG